MRTISQDTVAAERLTSLRLSVKAIAVVIVVFGQSGVGSGAEGRFDLPDDGWWARYTVKSQIEDKKAGTTERIKSRVTFSLTGTVAMNDRKYRWVERSQTLNEGDGKFVYICKILVPESDLLCCRRPEKKALRVWMKIGDGPVQDRSASTPTSRRPDRAAVSIDGQFCVFPGMVANTMSILKSAEVMLHDERLELTSAYAGTDKGEGIKSGERYEVEEVATDIDFLVWTLPNPRSTIAVGKFTRTIRSKNLEMTRSEEWVIDDYGDGMESALPRFR